MTQGIRDDKWREWRLDELGEPTNTTRLDANASRHGLMPRLYGQSNYYLDGRGLWVGVVPVQQVYCYDGDAVVFDGEVVHA